MRRRNANGSGTIVRRADGRWEGKYTVGRTAEGKQKRRSVYGKTQAECRKKLDKAIVEYDEGVRPNQSSDITVQTWIETWIDCYVSTKVKPLTLDKYKQDCRLYIYPTLGRIRLKNLTTEEIQEVYNALAKTKAAKTVHNVHGVLHGALKKAKKLGYISSNPSEDCELPKKTRPKMSVLTNDDDVRAFFREIEGDRFEYEIKFDFCTGVRLGELLGLTWDCVDLDNNVIVIDKQLRRSTHGKGGYYLLDKTKTDSIRTIVITPFAANILKKQQEKQVNWRRTVGDSWDNSMNLVFTTEFGKHLCHYTVYKHFKDAVRRIGRSELRFHDLRHSFATMCIEDGDPIKAVQETLGHSTANTTLNFYSHTTTEMQRSSASRLEKRLQSIQNESNSRQNSRQEKGKTLET